MLSYTGSIWRISSGDVTALNDGATQPTVFSEAPNAPRAFVTADDRRLALAELAAAFAKLPSEQREALVLVGALGFSLDEAAQTCGCAPGTIKSSANRGRRALAGLLRLKPDESMDLTDNTTLAVMAASGTNRA
ncbi:MAG: hypothetical protein JJT95_14705 [Pararhodobacter sp.]|nr:hypothetical protein [Pararhodobacter sp.]